MKIRALLLSILLPVAVFAQSSVVHRNQVLSADPAEVHGTMMACYDTGVARLPACSATGELYVNPVGSTSRICATIVPDTNAFAANDIVGPAAGASGLLTFASALRAGINSGILQSIEVTNTEIDGIAFDFCLFNASPTSAGSAVAANAALTLVTADLQKLIGCVSIADGRAFATTESYQAQGVNMSVDAAATTLYGILRTTGAPTWAAEQTVNVCITVVQD